MASPAVPFCRMAGGSVPFDVTSANRVPAVRAAARLDPRRGQNEPRSAESADRSLHGRCSLNQEQAPYHAHVYYEPGNRGAAEQLRAQFLDSKKQGRLASLPFVGEMRDQPVGPHPKPQFEIHFGKDSLQAVMSMIRASGLTALVHPLTDDDLADHTTLAIWIGEPLELDCSVLDPPGMNQGVARFGKSDF